MRAAALGAGVVVALGVAVPTDGAAQARVGAAPVPPHEPGEGSPAAADGERTAPARRLHAARALEVWGGLAFDSPAWGVLGASPAMNLGVLALRFSRGVGAGARTEARNALEYTVDLVPLAVLSPPYRSLRGLGLPCAGPALCVLPQAGDRTVFPPGSALGVGVSPIGFVLALRRDARVAPTLGATGGFLYFDRRVPTTEATRFNFTAGLEAGLRLGDPGGRAATVTYRFHHLSNGGTSTENPGVASHLLTVGVRFPRSVTR